MTSPQQERAEQAVCYRHGNRPTNVSCQNCGRPICADCMRDTPVGFRCPECAGRGKRQVFRDDLVVTKVLLAACWVVFLYQAVQGLAAGGNPAQALLSAQNDDLATHAGLWANAMVGLDYWWQPVTSGFLHAGLLHIALNSWFIYVFGSLLEPALGRLRFGLVYFTSLLGGAVGALLLSTPNAVTVGASGAGFGLLGASLVMAKLRRNDALAQQFLLVAVINFAFTFTVGGISIGGHLGGFLVGAACGYLVYGPVLLRKPKVQAAILAGAIVVLFVAAQLVAQARAVLPPGVG